MKRELLDVGCGDGSYALREEWPKEYDYRGIDIDPERVEAAQDQGLSVREADVTEGLDYPDESFDRVVAKAVLEHVSDPLFAARECYRVLRAGGRLDVIVPSDRSYDVWGDYTHRRAFRGDALRDLLEDAGFHHITIEARMGWTSVGMAIKSIGRIAAPWTPYGYPRAWDATARKWGDA